MFHTFTVESSEFRSYALYIDDQLAFQGTFFDSLFSGPGIGWGDMSSGRSVAEWSYVEAGITPECDGLMMAGAALLLLRPLRRSAD